MNALLDLEVEILTEGREWTRRRLEERAQKQINDWGVYCPQSGELLKFRKRQRLKVLTCVGMIELKTWRGYSPALGRWLNPARERWGLQPKQRLSPELQSRLGFTATVAGSYQKAAATAQRWGTPISDNTVHAVVQQLGGKTRQLTLPQPAPVAGEAPFALVLMMDGWLARQRGVDWGASKRKKEAERVNWKEVKSAVIYRLDQSVKKNSGRGMLIEKYVVAQPPDTEPVDFSAAVQAEALRRGLGRAHKVYVVIDGAVWLRRRPQARRTRGRQTRGEHMRLRRMLRGCAAVGLVLACTAPPRLGAPRVYAQYSDSISEHCKYHPEACAGAFGAEGGATAAAAAAAAVPAATAAAAATTSVDAIVATGAGVLAASIVATVRLNPNEEARVEDVLKLCADKAYSDVLKHKFGGKNPSVEQCTEQVGIMANGEPITFAMKLGEEMHLATYRCLRDKLPGVIPGRYSIEQRYRFNPRNGRTMVVTAEDEALLRQHGAGDELRYSIVPDLIIHRGDPRYIQAVYDFKFPCAAADRAPAWRRYPEGHPATGPRPTNQAEVYKTMLQHDAYRVAPGTGVSR